MPASQSPQFLLRIRKLLPYRSQIMGLAVCAVLYLLHIIHFWPQVIDDAFITYRYSLNILSGHGITYNAGGEWTEGFTNPLWTFLHILPLAVGVSPLLFSKILGTLFGLLTLIQLNRLTAFVRKKEDWINCSGALLLAGFAPFAYWSVAGLETTSFVFFILAFTYWFWRWMEKSGSIVWGVLLFLAVVLSRIDGLWFCAPIFVLMFTEWRIVRGRRDDFIRLFCALAGVILIMQATRLLLFGDWLPNTYYAKLGNGSIGSNNRAIGQLQAFYLSQTPNLKPVSFLEIAPTFWTRLSGLAWLNLMLISLGVVMFLRSWSERFVIFGFLASQVLYIWITKGDWMPNFRFFLPTLPLLLLVVPLAFDSAANRMRQKTTQYLAQLALSLLLLGVLADHWRWDTVYVFDRTAQWYRKEANWWESEKLKTRMTEGYSVSLRDISITLAEELPENTSVLMSDIGLPGWVLSDANIIDVDGLTNKKLAGAPSANPDHLNKSALTASAVSEWMQNGSITAVLVFEQHFGKGPDSRGYRYPEPASIATQQAEFSEFTEVWRGVKAVGDVWNHLYVAEEKQGSATIAAKRMRLTLERTPRLGILLPAYYDNSREAGTFDVDFFEKLLKKNRGNSVALNEIYAKAMLYEDKATVKMFTVESMLKAER